MKKTQCSFSIYRKNKNHFLYFLTILASLIIFQNLNAAEHSLPDAVVSDLSYANGVFTSVVTNQGNQAIPEGTIIGVGYFVDGNQATWGAVLGPLAAGASVTVGTDGGSFVIDDGPHEIMADVDDVNRFEESNENNNQLTVSIGNDELPDAVVSDLSYANGVFTSVVTNQGNQAIPEGTIIGVGYFVDGNQATWGAVLGPLAAGASVTVGTNGGSFVIDDGPHEIMADVDDVNRFEESNENNNQLTVSIGNDELPDAVVSDLSYANGVFTSVVTNQGNQAIPEGTIIGVGYFVEGNQATWGAVLGPLAAGASVNVGTDGGSFAIDDGPHEIMADVDDLNRFEESNENNNQLTVSIDVGADQCTSSEPINEPSNKIYVAPNGNDSASGSQNQPLRTLAEAARRFSQGGTVIVRGGVYPHQRGITANGTPSNLLVFKAASGETPIFDGGNINYEWGSVLEFYSAQNTAIIGFEIRNGLFHRTQGVETSVAAHNFIIKDSHIHHLAGSAARIVGTDIRIEDNRIHDIVLENENNTAFPDSGWSICLGIAGDRSDKSNPWRSGGIIRGNHVSDCWGEGISAWYQSDIVIEDNVVNNSFNVGIYLDNTSNIKVTRNFVKLNRGVHGSPGTGILIGIEDYGFWDLPNRSTRNIEINNNVAVAGSGMGFWVMVERPTSTFHNIEVVNNTLIATHNSSIGFATVNTSPAPSGNIVANNLNSSGIGIGNPGGFTVQGNGTISSSTANINKATDARRFVSEAGKGAGEFGVNKDFLCANRANPPTKGAFEK